MVLNSYFPQALIWGTELLTIYNDAFAPILGHKSQCLGQSFARIWAEVWEDIEPIARRALRGEGTFIENFPLMINRFGHAEEAFFTFSYSPIRDEFGSVQGFLDTVIETTETVVAQHTMRLLNSELAHRLQNTLAVVPGISDQTLRRADSVNEARRALTQRISALGRTHSMLIDGRFQEASLQSIIEQSLAPISSSQHCIAIAGPPLLLRPRQAMSLALAVNELVTHAVKHGALSAPGGRLSIFWETIPGKFRFIWEERDGPPVIAPVRQGFGSRLIREVLPQDFQGTADIEYAREGLRVTLTADLDKIGYAQPNLTSERESSVHPYPH